MLDALPEYPSSGPSTQTPALRTPYPLLVSPGTCTHALIHKNTVT